MLRVQKMFYLGFRKVTDGLRLRSAWPFGLLVASVLSIPGVASAGNIDCGGGSSGTASYLFDCRADEMVSPAYKEGYRVAVDGLSEAGLPKTVRVLADSTGSFSNVKTISPLAQQYEIARGAQSWEVLPLDAPFSEFSVYFTEGISPDFQSTLVFAGAPRDFSVKEVYLNLPDGSLVPVGPLEAPDAGGEEFISIGASEDLRHVLLLIDSRNSSSEEKNPLWPGDTTKEGHLPSLYEYDYTGTGANEPRLVGIDNIGTPKSVGAGHLISNCGISLGSSRPLTGDAYNAVSASGAVVFFTAAACGESGPSVNEVYARFRGTPSVSAHTVAISEPPLTGPGSVPGRECTGTCAAAESVPANRSEGVFAGASLDGSKAFFMTRQSLINGDANGVDLYEADIDTGAGAITRLIQVTHGGPGDPTPGSNANMLGVARISEDGSHLYFVAGGRLTGEPRGGGCLSGLSPAELAEEEATKEGRCRPKSEADNLYVYDTVTGRTSFVATLSSRDGADWSVNDSRPVQATPDGRFLVFQSTADLTPDQQGRKEAGQVFEYDANTETLVRVSHGQEGYNEDGNSSEYQASIPVQGYEREVPLGIGRFTGLAISEDGSRVFFSSKDALTPQAVGGVTNVYEYHEGQVGLISDGHDPTVYLVGTDESGRDVFFATVDRLVPQDTDNQVDVYDARIEGGFMLQPSLAPCVGDSCQIQPSAPPTLLVPGVSFLGGETAAPNSKPKAPSKKKPPSRKKRRKRKHPAENGRQKAHKSRGTTYRGRKATAMTGGR